MFVIINKSMTMTKLTFYTFKYLKIKINIVEIYVDWLVIRCHILIVTLSLYIYILLIIYILSMKNLIKSLFYDKFIIAWFFFTNLIGNMYFYTIKGNIYISGEER